MEKTDKKANKCNCEKCKYHTWYKTHCACTPRLMCIIDGHNWKRVEANDSCEFAEKKGL